jgi:cytochrome c nitrite reductase small subunit
MKRLVLALGVPAVVACAFFGALTGAGAVTVVTSGATSYLSDDPASCVNCHIMREQYDGWQKASHHGHATCNDCHTPTSFFSKYWVKAENGYWHSKGFTFNDFHEPIMIKPRNSHILQENCLACHTDMVHQLTRGMTTDKDAVSCVHCHINVGHGPPR